MYICIHLTCEPCLNLVKQVYIMCEIYLLRIDMVIFKEKCYNSAIWWILGKCAEHKLPERILTKHFGGKKKVVFFKHLFL